MHSRENGGLYRSWSWKSSNFDKDDIFDLSYCNPFYTPSYDISGFTLQELDIGRDTFTCILIFLVL